MSPKNKGKEDFLDELKKGTNKVIKAGMQFTKIASEKIDESTKIGIEKAKANPSLNKLKIKTEEATKVGIEKGKEIQEKTPGFFNKLCQKFQSGLEKFVGTIRRGTQYGKTSIEMLEQFAKMKELGIITDKEFEVKKKEILDRI
jgi:hypothetical protein